MKTRIGVRAGALSLALLAAAYSHGQAQATIEAEASILGGATFFLVDPPSQFAIHRGDASTLIVRDGEFRTSAGVGVNAGLRIADRFGVEGMFWWVPTRLSASEGLEAQGGRVDANNFMYGATLVYHFTQFPRIQPFAGLGVGGETLSYESHLAWERHTHLMANGVIGANVWLNDIVAVRMEVRDCITRFESGVAGVDDTAHNDLMLSAGLNFRAPLRRR